MPDHFGHLEDRRTDWIPKVCLAALLLLCVLAVVLLILYVCRRRCWISGRHCERHVGHLSNRSNSNHNGAAPPFQIPAHPWNEGLDLHHGRRQRTGTEQSPYQNFILHVPESTTQFQDNPVFDPIEEIPNVQNRRNSEIPDSALFPEERPQDTAGVWAEMSNNMDRSVTNTLGNKLVVYITRLVDHKGDTLFLDNMGISLSVPENAVNPGEEKKITLLLNWDLNDNPFMLNSQALVSPVVFVGPHGLKLNKPCVLRFMHCSFDTRHIQVMRSETDIFSDKKWEIMCQPNVQSPSCKFTPSSCSLHINTFTLYTCLQCPPDGQLGKKWIQIAVFSEGIKANTDHQQVRIYFLNKTNCALQWAIHNESKFGAKMICPEKLFLLSGTERDVLAVLTYVSRGWTVIDENRRERIPYLNIWHGKCPHVSVCFRRENPAMHELSLSVEVHQEERENEHERIIAQIIQPEEASIHPSIPIDPVPPRIIPQCLRTRLKVMLDVQCPLAQNWKALAEKLGYDGLIPFLETQPSPTEIVLQAMEKKNLTIHDLERMLHDIGRSDAAIVISEFLGTTQETSLKSCTREGVENEIHGETNIL